MNGEVRRLPNGNIIARRDACSYALSEVDNRSRAPHPFLLPSCMRRSRCSSFAAGIPCEIALKELARLYLRLEKGSPWPALGRQALSVPFTSEARALKWNAASGYSLGRFSTPHVQGTETEPDRFPPFPSHREASARDNASADLRDYRQKADLSRITPIHNLMRNQSVPSLS